MRVLLIQPDQKETIGFQQLGQIEPLGLEMIAGALGRAHETDLLDLRLAPGTLEPTLEAFRPELVGISSSFTVDMCRAQRIARTVKAANPKTFVFVGGHHPSLRPEDFQQPDIDAIVVGEGEITARELVDGVAQGLDLTGIKGLVLNRDGKQISTGIRPLIPSLDTLPLPRRDLARAHHWLYKVILSGRIASLETARGCPYTCKFCSVWRFYQGGVRYKSPQRVIQELQSLEEKTVFFTDDNFLVDVSRAQELGRLVKRHGLQRHFVAQIRTDTIARHPEVIAQWRGLGLRNMFVGFEKPDQHGLESINKHNSVENNERALAVLRQHGIEPITTFITNPDYTREDFAFLRAYIRRLKLRTPSFSILTPLPGTELFDQKREHLTTHNYELWDIAHAVLPTRLPLKQFYGEFAALWRTAYPRWKLTIADLLLAYRGWRFEDHETRQMRRVLRQVRHLHDPRYYLGSAVVEDDIGLS